MYDVCRHLGGQIVIASFNRACLFYKSSLVRRHNQPGLYKCQSGSDAAGSIMCWSGQEFRPACRQTLAILAMSVAIPFAGQIGRAHV